MVNNILLLTLNGLVSFIIVMFGKYISHVEKILHEHEHRIDSLERRHK